MPFCDDALDDARWVVAETVDAGPIAVAIVVVALDGSGAACHDVVQALADGFVEFSTVHVEAASKADNDVVGRDGIANSATIV